jgi:lysophospholipase L1-like esterase
MQVLAAIGGFCLKDIFDGKTVLFQGDSITDCGRDDEFLGSGYPAKVAEAYRALMPASGVKFINRGISGNRTVDLVNRYEKDFKDVAPDFISILIGINDVWRAFDSNDPMEAQQFESNYRTLLSSIKNDMPDTQIMIMEPFLLHSLPDRPAWHIDLDPKIQVVRKLAYQYADIYLPLDGIMARCATSGYTLEGISEDGVHPSQLGHGLIAYEWLKATGVL